tara:strand:+ start:648 stop:2228 length:1581 start_codon:yes stop_codon:yes gene_type:complete
MALTEITSKGIKDATIVDADIATGTITAARLGNDCVGSAELQNSAVATVNIADQAVDLTKLPHGDGTSNGKFLRSNNGADPTWETVSTTPEGTTILSTGESGGTKFLREDGDGSCSWQTVNTTPEGTAVLSTGESGGTKFLREDGDGSCSWQTVSTTPADGSITQAKVNFPVSNRNLMINGAMLVAQRGAGPNEALGYGTVDRFEVEYSNVDQDPSQAQVDVASGTPAFQAGFRKAYKIINGNQTNNAGAGDQLYFRTTLEARDIACSGWDYTSTSSYITLSFWIKSSVAQNFYGYIRTHDGTNYHYPFETGSLTQNTWTKVTKTIPGNANLQFDNDIDKGLQITWLGYFGTNQTSSNATLNTWRATGSGNDYTPDNTVTWYETDDATLELTGVQLEVGSVATDFEHKQYNQDLTLCQRYYYTPLDGTANAPIGSGTYSYGVRAIVHFPVQMRTGPSIVANTATDQFYYQYGGNTDWFNTMTLSQSNRFGARVQADGNVSNPTAGAALMMATESSSAVLAFNAELL